MRKKVLVSILVFIMTLGNCAGVMAGEDDIFVDTSGFNVTGFEENGLDGNTTTDQYSASETEKELFSDTMQDIEINSEVTDDGETVSDEVGENLNENTEPAQKLEQETEKESSSDLMQGTELITEAEMSSESNQDTGFMDEEIIIDNNVDDGNMLVESENEFIDGITTDSLQIGISEIDTNEQKFSGSGTGTKSSPYIISNAQQLDEIRYNLSAYYIIDSDIELSDIPNWNPIGDETTPFSGNLDGRNHTIDGLTIDTEELDYVGLFGSCSDAIIKNINLKNVSIKVDKKSTDYTEINSSGNGPAHGAVYVGALVAESTNVGVSIENCTVHGFISVVNCHDASVGGIIASGNGYQEKENGCINYANIYVLSNKDGCWGYETDGEVYCGGIVGYGNEVSSCENYGNIEVISGNMASCGGICGADASIDTSINYGNISGQVQSIHSIPNSKRNCNIGGIEGSASNTIQYCINYGNVSSSAFDSHACAGGIAGWNRYYSSGEISHCINMGESIEVFDMRDQDSLTYAQDGAARISVAVSSIAECYSLETVKVNGILPTSNIGTDQINGESLSLDDIQQVIKNNYAGNSMVISTFPSNGENNVNPKLYGEGYDITVCFDGVVTAGEGYISIINLNTDEVLQYDVGARSDVILEESVLTIPSTHLDYGSIYSIQFDAGCVYVDGKKFFGLSGESDWTFTTREKVDYVNDTWSFVNPDSWIPVTAYSMFFPPAMAWQLQKSGNGLGGHCAGMVLTSMASYLEYPLVSSYSNGKYRYLNEVEKNSRSSEINATAIAYINYAYTFQFVEPFVLEKNITRNDYNGLYKAVNDFEQNDGEPVYIAIGTGQAGHALMGLKISEITDDYTKILVYDCNHPNTKCYLTLNGSKNNYHGWSYDLSNSIHWDSNKAGARIHYVTMGADFIKAYKAHSVYHNLTLLSVPANINATVNYNGESKSLSSLNSGSMSEIIPILPDTDGGGKTSNEYWIRGANDSIEINSLTKDADISIVKDTSEIIVTSVAGTSLYIDASKNIVKIQGQAGSAFKAGFNEYDNESNSFIVSVNGKSDGEVNIRKEDDNFIVDGTSELYINKIHECQDEEGNIKSDGNNEILVDKLNPDHEYSVTTDNSNNISISEDTNGDGIFDTDVASTKETVECEHKWTTWKIIKQPTVLAKGEQQRTCSICNKVEKQDIARLKPTIKLNATSIKLKMKQSTTKIKVTGLAKGDAIKSWKSSNKKIVRVNSKGKITACSKTGKATITVTLKSGLSKKITVKVQKGAVACTKVTLNKKSVTLKKGKAFTLKPTIKPITCVQKAKYSSSNKKVATVTSKGKIVAKKKGKATITVTVGKKKVKCKVTVK